MIISFCLISFSHYGQYTPYFKNYSISDYGAGNQNWGIAEADDGRVYVANNGGLLEYDGLVWEFYELPNKTTIRSVFTKDNRVYTGSYEEFGYWERDSRGLLNYYSLSDLLKDVEFKDEEFWQISGYHDKVIFRSFSGLYVYDGKGVKMVDREKNSSTIISCSIVNNKFLVSTLKKGIFELQEDKLIPFYFDKQLVDTKVISIVPIEDKLLLATALKGNFLFTNDHLVPWNSEITDIAKEHLLNAVTVVSDKQIVFGTIKNGIYITDYQGRIQYHINKENGLINNTVLAQHYNGSSSLWLGLDNGMVYIELNNDFLFYRDITGKLGAVYDIINYQNKIYIGSNTGLFYMDNNNDLQFVEDTQGQVWDLKIVDDKLFCGHNEGTFIVNGDEIEKISNYTGGWVIQKVPEKSNIYIQGTYAGLVRFKHQGNNWNVKHLGKTTVPARFLVFENANSAWVAHAYKGLYKVEFSKDYDTILDVQNYSSKGLYSDYNVRIYKIRNDIFFKTNNGWQKYEPVLDSIIPYTILDNKLGKDAYIISDDIQDKLVIKDNNDVINFKSFLEDNNELSIASSFLKNRLIVGFEKLSKLNDSISALNLNDGFVLINDNYSDSSNYLESPHLDYLQVNKEYFELFKSDSYEIPFKSNVTLAVSSPKSKDYHLEYQFSNLDDQHWYKLDNQYLELSNLMDGNYEIHLRSINGFGDFSKDKIINLTVLPPWYKSWVGLIIYFIVILLISLIMLLLHKRKILKEQNLLKDKFNREQENILKKKALENEKSIVELKNQSLQNEVKLKSKQLANTAMALVKKNETLQDIKKELLVSKKDFGNYFTYKKLLKQIDSSIGHDDEWEVFEYNFNQVHEEFFNELKKRHPNLTHKDLKVCAYIKMNLTTKEIAPLLNISIRGVETHRYRLKKKLDLENDNSVSDYLIKFK